jgi:hypothetical protein
MRRQHSTEVGSVLVWTVVVIAILSLIATETLRLVTAKYLNALQTSTWQEALLAAESGIDLAIVELRKSLYPQPNNAWQGWNNPPGNSVTGYELTTVPNAGLNGTPMTIETNVDAPSQLIDPTNSWQYYRIRTVGTIPITGPARASDNPQDTKLRRLSLRFERFTNGLLVAHPLQTDANGNPIAQISRRIEAIVRPVSSFDQAIMSVGVVDLTNQNIVVDSYDSSDPTKSTNGLYDPAKRQENGDIATDGQLIEAGNAQIFGDVATNAGTVSGAANITGVERTDFYQEPIPVGAPSWSAINSLVTSVTDSIAITAAATQGSAASRFVLSQISLSGNKTLTIAGNPLGTQTYVEIYVTGDINVNGIGQIVVQPGVTATIYFAGNVDISGNGVLNSNNQPGDLMLYGIQPPTGTTKHVNIGGNSQITASVYAPGHDVTINGGGTNGHVYGSMVGKTVTMTGVSNLHYDEQLGSKGMINNYKIVSWFEDNR